MPQKTQKQDLFSLLSELKDHRRKQGQRHSLQIVLMIVIMGIMSGLRGERAISRFAKNNEKELIESLQISRKEVPSRSVIKGAMQELEFESLERIFYNWSIQFVPIEKGEWINLDGKAIRGTVKNANSKNQNFVSLVSVFVGKRKQVLSAGKIDTKKESEIPKVRELIKILDLENVTFTLDALHCQKKTITTILETRNDYLIGVKGNQAKLHNQLKKTSTNQKQLT